ncbi:L-2-amino-thiazoline-4-carboxylic acid hydrolase [Desulfogranum mediterraneum]|uniref:L-2-amino-thiazoline-4-carboxylic acid hydrolase n=1 Tax=Desulfogranum mediterraneum TaxID=160661 RepID=UPI00048C5616|nr:L-2-amino-thiazoline-4-carboxylic acid hydrolase [Desulfogranum mediterraneum]
MKKYLRLFCGLIAVFPLIVSTRLLSIFVGQDKAVKCIGPLATAGAKRLLKYWVPRARKSDDFDSFAARMKENFWLWRPLYDIEIQREEKDVFELYISNCPFCEILNSFGLSTLSRYVCEGDWEIAKEHPDQWLFERSHQIGSGDTYCNHTYKRIMEDGRSNSLPDQ